MCFKIHTLCFSKLRFILLIIITHREGHMSIWRSVLVQHFNSYNYCLHIFLNTTGVFSPRNIRQDKSLLIHCTFNNEKLNDIVASTLLNKSVLEWNVYWRRNIFKESVNNLDKRKRCINLHFLFLKITWLQNLSFSK